MYDRPFHNGSFTADLHRNATNSSYSPKNVSHTSPSPIFTSSSKKKEPEPLNSIGKCNQIKHTVAYIYCAQVKVFAFKEPLSPPPSSNPTGIIFDLFAHTYSAYASIPSQTHQTQSTHMYSTFGQHQPSYTTIRIPTSETRQASKYTTTHI